jgi:GTPase KRas protein
MDAHIKVVTVGTGGVGKSATVVYLVSGIFLDYYDPTIEDLHRKTLRVDEEEYMLSILDTAGQEEFYAPCTPTALLSAMQGEWFQTGDAFLLMYAINSRNSFRGARDILKRILKVRECLTDDVSFVVCANKADLEDEREVSKAEGKEFADKFGFAFFEISAREGFNVVEVFEAIVRDVKAKRATRKKSDTETPLPRRSSLARPFGNDKLAKSDAGGDKKRRCTLI